jgi:hypothetical protein
MRVMFWVLFTGSFEVNAERMRQFSAIGPLFTVPNTAMIKLRFNSEGLWFSQIISAHLADRAAHAQHDVETLEAE